MMPAWGAALGAGTLAALAVLASACHGRPLAGATAAAGLGGSIAELDLSHGMNEEPARSLFGTTRGPGFTDLALALRELPGTEKAVLVRLGAVRVPLARAEEVARELSRIRKTVPVTCHADHLDNAGAMLVASCSRVWLSPAGGADTVGIAAQLLFANKLLKRLQIDVDFLQVGKYKGAEEPFTRDAPSPEARESLESTLRGLRTAWLRGFEARPSLTPAVLEDGPWSARDAKDKGLVDELGSVDQAREALKVEAGAARVQRHFGAGPRASSPVEELLELIRDVSGAKQRSTPHVAVVVATGGIAMSASKSPLDPLGGSSGGIAERELGPALAKLAKNDAVKAVVLRLDSPGGSALASDLLWLRLDELRKKKPLVASIGGMAASGGYYLACASSKIVAERGSILGSIGVVTGKFGLGRALDELGVHAETIAANPERAGRASYLSPFSTWDDATRARVGRSAEGIYDLFLERVGAGRALPIEAVKKHAEGRIYGGVEAKERGMVDELGGVLDAIALARKLAALPEDTPAVVVGAESSLAELLDGADASQSLLDERALELAEAALVRRLLRAMPELGAALAALSPLGAGEGVLAIAPFALVIR